MYSSITPVEYLRDLSAWLSSVHDPEQILELIIDTAARMLNAKASSILLVDEEGGKLWFEVATGSKKSEIKQYKVPMGQGIAGSVAETGKSILVKDVTKDPRWDDEISKKIGFKTHSIACSPMRINSKILGVLQAVDRLDGKPFNDNDLNVLNVFANVAARAISNARRIEDVNRRNRELTEHASEKYQIIGNSREVKKAVSDALKVADSKASVMVLGESGTGKELMARMIHMQSPRKDFPLIIINCGALTETLLEDELFGHEKGAYTGAVARKQGKFELADRGTLFLDEIGEMSLNMQTRLLRVLQEGVYYRVGGSQSVFVDVRIVSATNRDIDKDVKNGRFRKDLYYRLNVVQIKMPPLRKRKKDILLLADHFLEEFKKERGFLDLKFSVDASDMLMNHGWSGNIRELKNAVERAVIMGDGALIVPADLPFPHTNIVSKDQSSQSFVDSNVVSKDIGTPYAIDVTEFAEPGVTTLKQAVNAFKKQFIASTLESASGNRTKAARILNIQRTYLSKLVNHP
ncbi:MAG: sigma 54-interacting transcriptional regulator [Thermodesulfobacteriota bacterium]|nr:sigma 54-interacting transcriptional regulator [Thermodesulfobacteriota bacterium]